MKKHLTRKTRPVFTQPLIFKNKIRSAGRRTPKKMVVMRLVPGNGVQNVEKRDELFEEIRNAERENAKTFTTERAAKEFIQNAGLKLTNTNALNKLLTNLARTEPTAQFPEGLLKEFAKNRRTLTIPDVFRPQIDNYARLHGLGAIGGRLLPKRTLSSIFRSPLEFQKNLEFSREQFVEPEAENEEQEEQIENLRTRFANEFLSRYGKNISKKALDAAIPKHIDTSNLSLPPNKGRVFSFHLQP